jgi:hypothetical protein
MQGLVAKAPRCADLADSYGVCAEVAIDAHMGAAFYRIAFYSASPAYHFTDHSSVRT